VGRNAGCFIKVDFGPLIESMAERELFGHVKGVFTDALSINQAFLNWLQKGPIFID
jgi:DNA-binding NtrC family response regulator